MSCTVAIGTQWGDEGKAKMIDFFSKDVDIIVRYQGGANAGHTVVVGGKKYIFHLVPSGVLHKDKYCVVGNGLVLDPIKLIEEIEALELEGLDVKKRFIISDSVHLILPYHKAIDAAMEEFRESKLGTTQRGIGPCYSDKSLRVGIRAGDVFDTDSLKKKIELILNFKNQQLVKIYNKPAFTVDEIMAILDVFKEKAGEMIANSQAFLHSAINNNKKILLEGAQGFALDIDHGTYPYVTSSNPTIGGALAGSGLNAFNIDEVIGITKAYVTRVGEGPFPTEDTGDDGDRLRVNGKEFGSTTGRLRRCGWFDVTLVKQSRLINGLSSMVLTKLDVLTGFKKIKVAVGYELNGKTIDYFPADKLAEAKPIYKEVDGWDEDITEARKFSDLPKNTQKYVNYLEKLVGIPVSMLSVGPDRDATFYKEEI